MNPSKTANPTTGVIEADPYSCLTRKNVSGITHLFKQTRYWILKPQTHTHHHNPKKRAMFTGGIRFIIATPHPNQPNPTHVRPGQTRQKPCPADLVPGGATRYITSP